MASAYRPLDYFFSQKSAGTQLKFVHIQLFLKIAQRSRFGAISSLPVLHPLKHHLEVVTHWYDKAL